MTFDEQLSTRELRRALQRSEGRRIFLLIVVVAAYGGFAWVRHVLGGMAMQGSALNATLVLAGVGVLYGGALLAWVRRADARDVLLPPTLWAFSAVVESLLPTAGIFILQQYAPISRLSALGAPVSYIYGIILILSILRLRPWICLLTGGLCAAGNLILFLRVFISEYDTVLGGTFGFHISYTAYLLLGGIAAALVSVELRRHLMGSLREADARNTLDLVRKELDIARSVQQALMPKAAPNLPGFDIDGWNRPASETGGDYYDWQFMPDGRLAVAIADVTGHGLGPAMLMAVCRAYARACLPVGPELRDAMSRVNVHLHGDV
jgi:stage II sporulation SpoE-like protein